MVDGFERTYPSPTRWIKEHGWIEIGQDSARGSFVLALEEGGLFWDVGPLDGTVDDALRALDAAVEKGMREELGV